MLEFAYGLIIGIMIMKILDRFSPSFKEDTQGQEFVYDKGYKDGYAEAMIEHSNLR